MVAPVIDSLRNFPQPLVLRRVGDFFVSDDVESQVTVTTGFGAVVEVRLILPGNLSLTFMDGTRTFLVVPPTTFPGEDTRDIPVRWKVRRRASDTPAAQVSLRVEAAFQGVEDSAVRLHQMAVVEQAGAGVTIAAVTAAAVTAGVVAIRAGRKRAAKKRAAARAAAEKSPAKPARKKAASKKAGSRKTASKKTTSKKAASQSSTNKRSSKNRATKKSSSKKTTKRSTKSRR